MRHEAATATGGGTNLTGLGGGNGSRPGSAAASPVRRPSTGPGPGPGLALDTTDLSLVPPSLLSPRRPAALAPNRASSWSRLFPGSPQALFGTPRGISGLGRWAPSFLAPPSCLVISHTPRRSSLDSSLCDRTPRGCGSLALGSDFVYDFSEGNPDPQRLAKAQAPAPADGAQGVPKGVKGTKARQKPAGAAPRPPAGAAPPNMRVKADGTLDMSARPTPETAADLIQRSLQRAFDKPQSVYNKQATAVRRKSAPKAGVAAGAAVSPSASLTSFGKFVEEAKPTDL